MNIDVGGSHAQATRSAPPPPTTELTVAETIGELEVIAARWRSLIEGLQQYAEVELVNDSESINSLNSVGNQFNPYAVRLKVTYRRDI